MNTEHRSVSQYYSIRYILKPYGIVDRYQVHVFLVGDIHFSFNQEYIQIRWCPPTSVQKAASVNTQITGIKYVQKKNKHEYVQQLQEVGEDLGPVGPYDTCLDTSVLLLTAVDY